LGLEAHRVFRLPTSGRYEIGPLTPGISDVRLLLPQSEIARGSLTASLVLCQVKVPEDGQVAQDLLLSGLYASLQGFVTISGRPAEGLRLQLLTTINGHPQSVEARTDNSGNLEPVWVFPGDWLIRLKGPGWLYDHPETIATVAGGRTRFAVDVDLVERSVRFVDARNGDVFAHHPVSLVGWAHERLRSRHVWSTRRTDDKGRATWTLPSGIYRFAIDSPDEEDLSRWRVAEVLWAAGGEAEIVIYL
jgi:hypothetical protein